MQNLTKDPKTATKTRLATTDSAGRNQARGVADAMDTPDSPEVRGKRCRKDDLHLASVADKEVAQGSEQ